MRRYVLPVLMISLLLTGCGESSGAIQRRIAEQNQRFAAAEALSFTARVTADLGSEVFDCTLACTDTPEETCVEVIAPESVAGVRARLRDGGVTVDYGVVSLGVGTAGAEGLSPITAPALLAQALRSGFLQRVWTERDGERQLLAAELYICDDANLTLWYDGETMTPVHGEFSVDGAVTLKCTITDFTYR